MPSPKGLKARRALRNRLTPEFMDKMDNAFTDLRADYELGDDLDPEKLRVLQELDVETGVLDHLVANAKQSSGLITGLRGTGKSHLFLLAQDRINRDNETSTLAVYVNLKRLRTIANSDQDILERVFILLLVSSIKRELSRMVMSVSTTSGFLPALRTWLAKRHMAAKVDEAAKVLTKLEQITRYGEDVLRSLSELDLQTSLTSETGRLTSVSAASTATGKVPVAQLESYTHLSNHVETQRKKVEVESKKFNDIPYISILQVRMLLVQVVKSLGLRSIVFFIDEWSKLSKTGQEQLSTLVDSLIDDPIFVWIAVVTHDYTLGTLEVTADLPHRITLDNQLVFERDRAKCKSFFTDFVNKRLAYYTGLTDFTCNDFIRDNALELLIMASMGNARDFGIMLQHAWLLFKQEKMLGVKKVGGQAWYIGLNHVEPAIKQLGKSKLDNLDRTGITPYAKRLWNELKAHVQEKGHTHFCIANTPQEKAAMDEEEMTYLLKHRLVLVRDEELSVKSASDGDKTLTLCALDFSCLDFDRNSWLSTRRQPIPQAATRGGRKRHLGPLLFVVDWDTIHNRVRRYTFPLHDVLSRYKVERGEQHICHHCGFALRPEMRKAWEDKFCPSCGNNPFEKPEVKSDTAG